MMKVSVPVSFGQSFTVDGCSPSVGAKGDAEALVALATVWWVGVALRGPAILSRIQESTSTDNSIRPYEPLQTHWDLALWIWAIKIFAPLPDITKHVEQAKSVWQSGLDRALLTSAIVFEPCDFVQLFGWRSESRTHRPRARGKLPFIFIRQIGNSHSWDPDQERRPTIASRSLLLGPKIPKSSEG